MSALRSAVQMSAIQYSCTFILHAAQMSVMSAVQMPEISAMQYRYPQCSTNVHIAVQMSAMSADMSVMSAMSLMSAMSAMAGMSVSILAYLLVKFL